MKEQRVIKFRVFHTSSIRGVELSGYECIFPDGWKWMSLELNPDDGRANWYTGVYPKNEKYFRSQFTGLLDKAGNEIYEDDIRREEIENDEGDEVYYCVMTYITEWSMFAWLSVTHGEYDAYLSKGAEVLDTVMYWSYPAGQEDQNNVTVCGNVHQHKHLIE